MASRLNKSTALTSILCVRAREIVQTLHEKGFLSYFAGGFVRDTLLDLPTKDIDIATSAPPQDIKKIFHKTLAIGEHFGVILVFNKEFSFEVATFRCDLSYTDGRHPKGVLFSNPIDDAQRRDFTINGLFYNPLNDQVIDHVDGQQDLKDKKIRCIGNPLKRFEEDKLRLIRAIRFATQLDFSIEPETWQAVCQKSSQIRQVSGERIREELSKILTQHKPSLALILLKKSGLFHHIFPEWTEVFSESPGVLEQAKRLSDCLHEKEKNPPFTLLFAALFYPFIKAHHKNNKGKTQNHSVMDQTFRNLRFSNKDRSLVRQYMEDLDQLLKWQELRESSVKKILRKKEHLYQLSLLWAYEHIKPSSLKKEAIYASCIKALKNYNNKDLFPERLISGQKLIQWGLKPSKTFTSIIKNVENLQLENKIKTEEDVKKYIIDEGYL